MSVEVNTFVLFHIVEGMLPDFLYLVWYSLDTCHIHLYYVEIHILHTWLILSVYHEGRLSLSMTISASIQINRQYLSLSPFMWNVKCTDLCILYCQNKGNLFVVKVLLMCMDFVCKYFTENICSRVHQSD